MKSSETTADFERQWLQGQQQFWEKWRQKHNTDADFQSAQIHWEQTCEQWWENVGNTLPPPLDTQARAALQQTRLYLCLARNMAAKPFSSWDAAQLSIFEHQQIFQSLLDTWSRLESGTTQSDRYEDRYLLAYSNYMQVMANLVSTALEHARDRLTDDLENNPVAVFGTLCEEIERTYRAEAGSDSFARLVGELVNSRIQMLPCDLPTDDGNLAP